MGHPATSHRPDGRPDAKLTSRLHHEGQQHQRHRSQTVSPTATTTATAAAASAVTVANAVAKPLAYGDNGPLREWLEAAGIAYVVAVSCDHHVPVGAGKAIRADTLAAKVPARGWQRVSCGPGSTGERLYDWAFPRCQERDRPRPLPGQKAHCLVPAHHLGHAGARVPVRHRGNRPKSPGSGLIPVTLGEVRRLLAHLITAIPARAIVWAWSRWRRTHQHRARTSHYQRRQASYNEVLLSY